MRGLHALILLLIAIFTLSSCKREPVIGNYISYEERFPGISDNKFTLYLFNDSTFIYNYSAGNGRLEKEIGTWRANSNVIQLINGASMDNGFNVRYETGTSDTLILHFDKSIITEFPEAKINLFDTLDIPIQETIIINKRNFLPFHSEWNVFNTYFAGEIKFKCKGTYFLISSLTPTEEIFVTRSTNPPLLNAKNEILFQFLLEDQNLINSSRTGRIPVSKLFKRSSTFNKSLSEELLSLADIDQKLVESIDSITKLDSLNKNAIQELQSKLTSNSSKAEKILDLYGYPGYDLVGDAGSYAFWLIVQHHDNNIPFQEKAKDLLIKQVARQNANGTVYAFLSDRININKGEPQIYGTQVKYDSLGQAIPKPLKDFRKVDSLRVSIGLDSLQHYLNFMTLMHLPPGKQSNIKLTISLPR